MRLCTERPARDGDERSPGEIEQNGDLSILELLDGLPFYDSLGYPSRLSQDAVLLKLNGRGRIRDSGCVKSRTPKARNIQRHQEKK